MNELREFLSVIKYLNPICYLVEWNTITFKKQIEERPLGKVWEVSFQNNPINQYSMKVIQVSPKTNSQKIREIIQEIRLLHSTQHPNILPLYGISVNETETIRM